MREFAKNCDIDLSRQIKLDEADIIIRDRHNDRLISQAPQRPAKTGDNFMYEVPEQNSNWDPDGQGEAYMGVPSQMSKIGHQKTNQSQHQYKKLQSQISQNLRQQLTGQKQNTLKTSQFQKMQSNQQFGSQISAIPKHQMSRQFTKLTTIKSQNFGGNQSARQSNNDQSQILDEFDQAGKQKPIEYIKIGDIILLKISAKVFQSDIEFAEAQQRKEEAGFKNDTKAMKGHDGPVNSQLFQKIVDDPLFIYQGVISSEGINNMTLQVLPKKTDENTDNAMAQFQKCLFQVECKSSIFYKLLIQEKLKNRDIVLDKRKKTAEKSDFEALSIIDQELKLLKEELDKLEIEKSLEDQNNAYMMSQRVGSKVQYGEEIQLRHIFTDKYLQIDITEMSDDHGAVKVDLKGLHPSSWIKIIPSRNELYFRSEMLINSNDAKKFNLQIGGHINIKDSFYMLNINSTNNQKYYLHIEKSKVNNKDGMNAVLEVNASLNPTKIRAKMFLPYQIKKPEQIYSGDVVRLLHIETNSYIQTAPRLSGTRSMFSQYPDFLQGEISELKNHIEDWEGDFKSLNFGGQEESVDLDNSDQDKNIIKEVKENELKGNRFLFLETESRAQSFTDSCFEIQNVDAFKGGPISLDQPFRLKQTVTEQYVSLNAEGLFLQLREDPFQQRQSVFKAVGIQNQGFHNNQNSSQNSLNTVDQTIEESTKQILTNFYQKTKQVEQKSQNEESELKSGSKVYIETSNKTYIQIFQPIQDDIEKMFRYKDFSTYEYYNQNSKGTQLQLLAGKKQQRDEDTECKMIFKIEKVNPLASRVTYECNSYLKSIFQFWEFLNTWAVVKNERAEALYTLCYDGDAAVSQEDLLTESAGSLSLVIQRMNRELENAANKDDILYKELQKNYCEQKIAECLFYLIELIYYKTVPPEYRSKPFKPDRLLKQKVFEISHESYLCYQIAKDRLDDLNLLILRTIVMLIRNNAQNCERISRFADTLFNQFRKQPNPYKQDQECELAKKIFCHMYKCANYIYNDRASVIKSLQGVNQNMPENFTKTHQISRWLSLLETVSFQDELSQNISSQCRYLKIISSFCKTMDKSKFKYHYQIQIVQRLFHFEANIPLWVGTQRRTDKSLRPYVYFARLQGETSDQFLQMNNYIANCYGQSLNQEGNRKFDIIFNIDELTLKYDDIPKQVGPYFDYIAHVIQLYAAICAGRNREAITQLRTRIGASDTFLLDQCTSHHRQVVQIIQRLKPAYLDLAKVLILEHQPFNTWSELQKNRVFFWQEIQESELHQTIYRWEKIKYGEDETNTYGTDNQSIRKSSLRLRQIITDYIEKGPQELIEFLYSSEKKQYSENMINPKLSQLNSYIECAISVLKSENVDTVFTSNMMDLAVQILLAVSQQDFIEYFESFWIYKLIRVVHKVPGCKVKEQKLVLQALEILKVINDHRLTLQILQFLKQFKEFEESSNFSHINFDTKEMDLIFKNLFSIQQFNIETKSLQILFLMLDPKRKVITDIYEEQEYERQRLSRLKKRALKESTAPTPRDTHRDAQGNVADTSFMITQRQQTARPNVVNVNKAQQETMVAKVHEDEEIKDQIKSLTALEEDKKKAQTNRDLPIDEYLLYFSLIQTQLRKIPSTALKIVYNCARQRQILLQDISKVELIVSETDRNNYKSIYFFKDRLTHVITRLLNEEYTYLLYKIGQHEQIKEKIVETQNVLKQLSKLIQDQPNPMARLKIQNIIRQIDFVDLILNQLLKTLYYDRSMHKNLFDYAMEFLFWFTFQNQQTSLVLRPHLAYLAELIKWDIESAKVMAQVISTEKLSAFGMKFHQFIIRKLVDEKNYKPQLFEYLIVVSQNEPTLQSFFLSQIVRDNTFRNRLYMKKNNEREKIEIIKELVRKRLIFGKGEEADKELASDLLKVNLHVSIVSFLASSGINNLFGLKQIRRLVELDRLMDALLAQSVPYHLKSVYFRLFYSGFLQQIGTENSLTINYGKFLQIIRFVVLYDLEIYHEFFQGLVVQYPPGLGEEAMNDPEWKRSKARVMGELDRQTKETQDKQNSRKTFKQKNEEKEMRAQLSPLNEGARPYPFLEEQNTVEYWSYLCSDNKQTGQSDGLLIFIRDMYKSLMKRQDQWQDELKDSTQKLYDAILQVTDTLDNLRDMYKQYIINIDSIMLALSEATSQIPSKSHKINTIQQHENDYEDEKEEEERMEKIMIITRDFIISKNLSIRDGFGIKSMTQDVLVHPYFIKRRIKDICGNDVNFNDIELMIRKIMGESHKKKQLQAVVGIELGQQGHVRTRHSAMIHEKNTRKFKNQFQFRNEKLEIEDSDLFNFKEFEQLLKSKLQKAGFKPPIKRRERVVEEQNFVMVMDDESHSYGCQGDLQHFIKCYLEFLQRYNDSDEINDLAKKILQKFNLLFIQGSKQNEKSIDLVEYVKLKQFLSNLVRVVLVKTPGEQDCKIEQLQIMAIDPNLAPQPDMAERNLFILCLITQLVKQLNPSYYETEIRYAANQRYVLLQRIATNCGLLKAAYSFIDPKQPEEVISQALKCICALIENENKDVLQVLYQLVQESSFNLLIILKTRIQSCIDRMLGFGKQVPAPRSKTLAEKVYDLPSDVNDPDLRAQPFYLPDAFSIEVKIAQEEPTVQTQELLQILRFCQSLAKGLPSFQTILVLQQKSEEVDLVYVIGESLIRITEIVKEHIYESFQVQQCLEELFKTMVLLSDGQVEIQKKYAMWHALQKTINFFLEQNYVYFSADSVLSRSKIIMMSHALNLLTQCVKTEDNICAVISEINLNNLKQQLITIFKFKIGGTPHLDHVFKTNKLCTHTGLCLEGQYCFFKCLVSFDQLTFKCAYNIFYVLQKANNLLPIDKLGKIRFNKQAGNLFLINRKKYLNQIYWESFERIQEEIEKIQKQSGNLFSADSKEAAEINSLLELIFVIQNQSKIERRFFVAKPEADYGEQQAKQLFTGIDKQPKLAEKDKEKIELARLLSSQNEFVKEEEEEYQYEEVFLELIKKATKPPTGFKRYCCIRAVNVSKFQAILRFLFCCSCCYKCRKQKIIYDKQADKIKFLFEKRKLAPTAEGRIKVDNFLSNRQIEIARRRDYTGPFTGSLTKQILQTTTYLFDQFKYDYVYRYMLSQMACVEIVNKQGNITRELFQIPTYCMYISQEDEKDLLLKLTEENLIDCQMKMKQFLFKEMPLIKLKMKQNQSLARISPQLYEISLKSTVFTRFVLVSTVIINLIFLQSYTYRYDPPKPPPVIVDQMAWLKEVVNYAGYVRYVPPTAIIIDPWIIRMKIPTLGMLIDLLSIINAVSAILAFITKQLSQNVDLQFTLKASQMKEDRFTSGSLASQLPSSYTTKNTGIRSKFINYILNLSTDKYQLINITIIALTCLGLVYQDQTYPFILIFVIFSELEVLHQMIIVLYKRLLGLLTLLFIAVQMIYLAGYYRFLNRSCMQVDECFSALVQGIENLGTNGWLELGLFLAGILIIYNLFLSLIIDSIAERRSLKQNVETILSQRCFICNLSKQDFELAKIDFEKHITEQHNPMSYLFYFMYVTDQSDAEDKSSNITRFVKEQIEKGSIDFIPQGQLTQI